MTTLKEIQDKFEDKTVGGYPVKIMDVFEGNIFARIYVADMWKVAIYDMEGAVETMGFGRASNLAPKKKHLPKDVLCQVWGKPQNKHKAYSNGKGGFYLHGADSNSTPDGFAKLWLNFKVIKNPIRHWEGGECPIPEGCEYRTRIGGGWYHCSDVKVEDWGGENHITGYQILGEVEK